MTSWHSENAFFGKNSFSPDSNVFFIGPCIDFKKLNSIKFYEYIFGYACANAFVRPNMAKRKCWFSRTLSPLCLSVSLLSKSTGQTKVPLLFMRIIYLSVQFLFDFKRSSPMSSLTIFARCLFLTSQKKRSAYFILSPV